MIYPSWTDVYFLTVESEPYNAIEQNSINYNFKLFPNPATNLLNINFGSLQENISYELLSLSGQLIAQKSLMDIKEMTIDLTSQVSGMYLLKIQLECGIEVVKITKK
jgi:hypothetical protein